jgi:hypothetical protein
MEPALLGLPSDGIPGRMCHQWPSLSLVRLVSIAYGGVRCQGGFSPSPPTYSYFPTSLRNFTTCLLTLTLPSDELGHRMCYLSCILWCKRTTLQLKHRRSNHNRMKSQNIWLAWTSTHQCTSWQFCPLDGVGFLIHWLNVHWPLFTFLMLTVSWGFFFSTLTSPAQLHTTQPSWTYLLLRTRLPPLSHLPTY